MAHFKLSEPMSVAMVLLVPTYNKSYGVETKTFPAVKDGVQIFGSFKTYGGTERDVNGVYEVIDTAVVETWYRSDIKSDCRIVLEGGETYEIMNEPENINLRNQYLRFKVKRIKGGA